MKYAEVIRDAWEITQTTPKLKWFAFVPAFMGVLIFVEEVAWQLFWYADEFGIGGAHLSIIDLSKNFLSFLIDSGLLWAVIFLVIFSILFVFVLPSWIVATLILSVRQKFTHPEARISLRQKMVEGARYFFRLFELHAVQGPFQFFTIAFFVATMYRFFHGDIFNMFIPVIIGFFIFSFFINIFFAFAPYFIVCENEKMGVAIRRSCGLVFMNFGRTVAVILLMFLVNFRIILNVLVIFGVPFGVLLAISYFSSSGWFGFAIFCATTLGIIALVLASYLTAIVEVFLTAVWERTFHTLRNEQKILESATGLEN